MPSLKTLLAAALAGSASVVHAAPTLERRTRNATTPKVIMDNVSLAERVLLQAFRDGHTHAM